MGQRLAVWPWAWDLKIKRDLLLSRDNYCTKFGNSPQKSGQRILSRQHLYKDLKFDIDLKFDLDILPHDLRINRVHIYTLFGQPLYQALQLSSNGIKRYCADTICTKTLTTDHVIWKSTGNINHWPKFAILKLTELSHNHCNKFSNSQAKGLKYGADIIQFDLDLFPCDLKSKMEHLL